MAEHTGGTGFDAVYDTRGGDTLVDSFHATRYYGCVTSCAAFGSVPLAEASLRALTLKLIYVLLPLISGTGRPKHRKYLERLSELGAAKRLAPPAWTRDGSL